MKNLVTFSLIGIGALYLLKDKIKAKINQHTQETLDRINVKLHKINGVNIKNGVLLLNIDLKLINDTGINYSLSENSVIKINKLEFFTTTGQLIAQATPNLNNIVLDPYGVSIIENIDVAANLEISTLLSYFSNPSKNIVTNVHLELFGKTIIV